MPWSTGMSFLKNIRSNEWNRLTGIPAIITGSRLAFIPRNLDLVISTTTQRVCSVADRNRQSSRSPTDSRPSLDTESTEQLGWPCISLLSEAMTRIATRRNGTNNPLINGCPAERLHRSNAYEIQSDAHPVERQMKA